MIWPFKLKYIYLIVNTYLWKKMLKNTENTSQNRWKCTCPSGKLPEVATSHETNCFMSYNCNSGKLNLDSWSFVIRRITKYKNLTHHVVVHRIFEWGTIFEEAIFQKSCINHLIAMHGDHNSCNFHFSNVPLHISKAYMP